MLFKALAHVEGIPTAKRVRAPLSRSVPQIKELREHMNGTAQGYLTFSQIPQVWPWISRFWENDPKKVIPGSFSSKTIRFLDMDKNGQILDPRGPNRQGIGDPLSGVPPLEGGSPMPCLLEPWNPGILAILSHIPQDPV